MALGVCYLCSSDCARVLLGMQLVRNVPTAVFSRLVLIWRCLLNGSKQEAGATGNAFVWRAAQCLVLGEVGVVSEAGVSEGGSWWGGDCGGSSANDIVLN